MKELLGVINRCWFYKPVSLSVRRVDKLSSSRLDRGRRKIGRDASREFSRLAFNRVSRDQERGNYFQVVCVFGRGSRRLEERKVDVTRNVIEYGSVSFLSRSAYQTTLGGQGENVNSSQQLVFSLGVVSPTAHTRRALYQGRPMFIYSVLSYVFYKIDLTWKEKRSQRILQTPCFFFPSPSTFCIRCVENIHLYIDLYLSFSLFLFFLSSYLFLFHLWFHRHRVNELTMQLLSNGDIQSNCDRNGGYLRNDAFQRLFHYPP